MIVGEKEEQLIALDISTDRQLGRVQGLPAEWRATVKRRVAAEAMGLMPSLQKTAIRFLEEQAHLAEQLIQEQAQHLEAARRSFEQATADTSPLKLEDWKQELSRLEEKVEQVRVEVSLRADQALPSI